MSFEGEILPTLPPDAQTAYRLWSRAKDNLSEETNRTNVRKERDLTVGQITRMIESLTLNLDHMGSKWHKFEEAMIVLNKSVDTHADHNSAIKSRAEDLVDELTLKTKSNTPTSQNTISVPSNVSVPTIRMPSVQIPEFGGESEQWAQFWILFKELVHDKTDLSYGVKFTYLRSAIKGNAKELIDGFTPNEDGYNDVISLLKDTYENKGLSQRRLYHNFLDMKSPRHNANELRTFRIKYMKNIRSLAHCVNVKEQLELIKEILIKKLAADTLSFIINFHKNPTFSYEQMDEALAVLVNILETSVVSSSNNPKGNFSRQHQNGYEKQVSCNSAMIPPSNVTPKCDFCGEAHASFKCPTYARVDDRRSRLMDLRACLKCGKKGHYAQDCRSRLTCFRCKRNHWSALCYYGDNNQKPNPVSHHRNEMSQPTNFNVVARHAQNIQPRGRGQQSGDSANIGYQGNHSRPNRNATFMNTVNVAAKTVRGGSQGQGVALPTAKLKILSHGKGKRAILARAFFDCGAQRSFISPELVEELGLKPSSQTEISLTAFGKDSEPIMCPVIRIKIAVGGRRISQVELLVTNKVDMKLNIPGLVTVSERMKREGLKLADNYTSDIIDDVKLVIGADYFGKFITGTLRVGDVNLLTSPAGHLLYGIIANNANNAVIHNNRVFAARITVGHDTALNTEIDTTPPPDITHLWDLEIVGINNKLESLTVKEKGTLAEFSATIVHQDNQYWVPLPWKEDPSMLPTNYRVARGQLNSLIGRLKGDREKFKQYDTIIKEYSKQGFIEQVDDDDIIGHYLPHHCVEKQSSTTPIRIVFNASSKSNKTVPSLNDMLEKGPSLTEGLVDSLAKFRTKKYAVTADISKAFLRIGLVERDRDYVRFLWVKGIDEDEPQVVTYRFRSVLFGSTSSPFLLQATLYRHFMQYPSEYKDLFLNAFYVDNFLATVNDETELINVYREICRCLQNAGMPTQLWNSNSKVFNEIVGDETREKVTNVLGLSWNTQNDTISLKPVTINPVSTLTKRRALSLVSTVYDPLGLLSPVTLRGKLLMRDIWKLKVGWDEVLPVEFVNRINELGRDFKVLHTIEFPRCVLDESGRLKLVVDCDASNEAYGACAYIVNENKQAHLYMSRTRVAPLKSRSIPQLELTALLVGCRLVKYICDTVSAVFKQIVVRSDSQVCICWISNNKSEEVYVRNRVNEIGRLCDAYKIEIQHVRSEDNLADILSRGSSAEILIHGGWRNQPITSELHDPVDKPPQVIVREVVTQQVDIPKVVPIFPVNRYSDIKKLFQVTTTVFKFLETSSKGQRKLPQASVYWIRNEQRTHYPLVYHCLGNSSGKEPDKGSRQFIKDLCLYLDDNGLLRSKGRICNAHCGEDMKYPILLPPKSFLTRLLIQNTHENHNHCGTRETLNVLRNEFWVPRGRQSVKGVVEGCVRCKYYNGKSFTYPGPPPLPSERVSFERPFQHTAVDYTGAIEVKDKQEGLRKYYICLFTCLATRAVHLELIDSLSAEAFIHCLRRFVARCSVPDKIYSDNGRNFVAVSKFLCSLQDYPEVLTFLVDRKIAWYFNVPHAPWQGGVFERMIQTVKSCLHKALHFRTVSARELTTILTEVETIVNNRPMTYLDSELFSGEALTPSHLLYGRKLRLYPNVVVDDIPFAVEANIDVLLKYHNTLSSIIKKFVRLWETEYLQSLREKHYNVRELAVRIPKTNEVVIVKVKDDRKSWELGKIVEVVEGRDGKVREVKVRHNGVISRMTVDKLIPLEVSDNAKILDSPVEVVEINESQEDAIVRPKRKAAQKADNKRQEWLKDL